MAKVIDWDGEPLALLMEGALLGDYLVPPVVLDDDDQPVGDLQAVQAVLATGSAEHLPVIRGATPDVLAEIDRRMAHLAAQLGVPIGTPDGRRVQY